MSGACAAPAPRSCASAGGRVGSRIRGLVLLALARSHDADEREVAHDRIADALHGAAGSLPRAAAALGVSRTWLSGYVRQSPAGPKRPRGRPPGLCRSGAQMPRAALARPCPWLVAPRCGR